MRDHPALREAAAGGDRVPLFVLDPAIADAATHVRTSSPRCVPSTGRWTAPSCCAAAGPSRLSARWRGRPAPTRSTSPRSPRPSGGAARRVRRRLEATARWWPPARRMPWAGDLLKGRRTAYQVFTPFSKAWRGHGWPAPRPCRVGCGGCARSTPRASRTGQRSRTPESTPPGGAGSAGSASTSGLRRPAGPARPRHDQPDVGAAEVRRAAPAHPAGGRRRAPRGADQGCRGLRQRAVLARVLRRRALAPPGVGLAGPPARTVDDGLHAAGSSTGGVAARRDGLPDGRRGNAPAAGRGLDAQPGADDHGELPREGPAHLVAARRPALPRPPARRRHREQQPRLAVGRRDGHGRRAVLPGVQPGHAGAEVRPRRRVCPPVGAELRHLEGKAAHEPWKHDDGYGRGYPERMVDHAEEREEALRRYESARRS